MKTRKILNIQYCYYLFVASICSIIVSIYFDRIYEYDSITFLNGALNSVSPTGLPGSQNYIYFLDIINTPYGLNWIIYLVNSYLLVDMIMGVKNLSSQKKVEHIYLILFTIFLSPIVLFYYLQPLREIFYLYTFYILVTYYYFDLRPKASSLIFLVLSLTFHVGHMLSVSLFLLYMIARHIFSKRFLFLFIFILLSFGSYYLIWIGFDKIFMTYLNSATTNASSNYSAKILTSDVHRTYQLLMLNYYFIIPTDSVGLASVLLLIRLTFVMPIMTIFVAKNFKLNKNIFEVLLLIILINWPWVLFSHNYFQAIRHAAPSIILFLIIFKSNNRKIV